MIWLTLFFTSLTPNIVLAFSDIFSDSYLVVEYHSNMINDSYVETHRNACLGFMDETPIPLQVSDQ